MPKRTVYIPKEIDDQYKLHIDEINLSEIVQMALIQKLQTMKDHRPDCGHTRYGRSRYCTVVDCPNYVAKTWG